MQDKDITHQNLQNSKIGIRKSEQDLSKELIQESEYPQHLKAFNPNSKVKKQIQPVNKVIKQVMTAEKEIDITKNEDLIKLKPQDFTNTRNPIEQHIMENKSEPNEIYRSNSINHSTNAKEEDSPTPHYHSDKYNPNLNLETNYFSLDKAKESQMNKNEEINEEISNRQQKQDK
ncbi:hypothetical protein O181_067132 [Austropuccinia psidii MF-1]|uniref:Uncharacterized protein n=1 Tax=Austropuccinia psidii MF-1 TaxID=1389203 RepID=A0A9Q3F073_9BASI|nr:hypothetical protein [Austropuccinia psidii MF-1]